MRAIKIETCKQCPYFGCGTNLTKPLFIPNCIASGNRILPYTKKPYTGDIEMAIPSYEIPGWCILPKYNDENLNQQG